MKIVEKRTVVYSGTYTCSFCKTIIELDDSDQPDGHTKKMRNFVPYGSGTHSWESDETPFKRCPSCGNDIGIVAKSVPA